MGKTIQVDGFPPTATLQGVRDFLERYTGSGTVYAMKKDKQSKKGCVIVQFLSVKEAELIISLASQRDWRFENSYLKVQEMDIDIDRKPRAFLPSVEGVTINFGCQISNERLCVLWGKENVSVCFGTELNKIFFFLSHDGVDYKIELSYNSVRKMQLYRAREQATMLLLIQLQGAPRIYVKGFPSPGKVCENPVKYFMGTPEDLWVRTTDFTSSCFIGQSSTLCLELPQDIELLNLQKNIFYYEEVDGQLIQERGRAYSCNMELVPMVAPPPGIKLPFHILIQTCSLVQQCCIPGPTLDASFYCLLDPNRIDIACVEHVLEKLYQVKECCYQPVEWLHEQQQNYLASERLPKPSKIFLGDGLVYVHRVQITPSRIYFFGPEPNISNCVLRHFSSDIDNFLRVSFVDEEMGKLRSTTLSPKVTSGNEKRHTEIYYRILETLRNGIDIGGKNFEFLAFSSSQLRENSAWFFASRTSLTAADIREWMGNFRDIKNVAKYATRLGQSFGSSKETLTVGKDEIEFILDVEVEMEDHMSKETPSVGKDGVECIPDMEVEKGDKPIETMTIDRSESEFIFDVEIKTGINKYVFSEGIGRISCDFAQKVAKKCGLRSITPSAFQIRYGGYKGVVAIDPLSSMKLSLRKSMYKYESKNMKLDVLAWSRYRPCFLNRQIITLLSTLGVEDHVFEKKQREEIEQMNNMLKNPSKAKEALELMPSGDNKTILKEMLKCGYRPNIEPFLAMMMKAFRASKLLDLRTKTRIFVQGGRAMMGCLDEIGTLEYGQAFVQFSGSLPRPSAVDPKFVSCDHGSGRRSHIVNGMVVVAKNPCFHPGDVRVLQAVDALPLHHMVDCIVFPQKGFRPHPNECSGSDLDGDIYFVCWDIDLIPPRQEPPADYTSAATMHLDHEVTIKEVQEYFTNYITSDSLGIISDSHAVYADREPDKAMSKPCIQLAKLFSTAVDFPKTGVPAQIPTKLRAKEYPDFMEKGNKPSYESQNVIGKLFREVKGVAPDFPSHFTQEVAQRCYDPDMEYKGFEYYIWDAIYYKRNYDSRLGKLMNYYGIKTEAEILSGGIIKMSRNFNRKRDGEAIALAVRSLKKEVLSWFSENEERELGYDRARETKTYGKASAWYYVTYHPSFWGCFSFIDDSKRDQYISFPWCVSEKLLQIKRRNSNTRVKSNKRVKNDCNLEISMP